MKKRKNGINFKYSYLVLNLCIVVFAVILMVIVYNITSVQTNEMGQQQLESMKNEVDSTVMHATYEINALAELTEQLTEENDFSRSVMDKFISIQSEMHKSLSNGQCFRVCYTRPGCIIVPGEDISDDYDISTRDWYNRALKAGVGNVYISAPYVDLFNSKLCFTVAKVLKDGITTVSLDYTLDTVQKYLAEIPSDKGTAIWVNSEGMIVAANDDAMNGQMLETSLPDMARTWKKISHEADGSGIIHQGMTTYFYIVTENDSYLIYSIDYFELQGKNFLVLSAILLFLSLVFIVLMILFARNKKSRKMAEAALHSREMFFDNIKDEFKTPLEQIEKLTSKQYSEGENEGDAIVKIRESSIQLNRLFENLLAVSAINHNDTEAEVVKTTNDEYYKNDTERQAPEKEINRLVILSKTILIILIPVIILFAAGITIHQGTIVMNNCSEIYYSELQEWVSSKKNTLDIMADMLESDSHLLNRYEECVSYLNDINSKNESISLLYIGNENSETPIIMSDGWTGNGNYVVQAYSWYANAKNSKEGYDVSTAHYDIDSRQYVVTISRKLTDANGQFIGVLGIDFNVSDLIASLESSYSQDEYAFLVTKTGAILNHPYSEYQISYSDSVDVADSVYKDIQGEEELFYFQDYDNTLSVANEREEAISGFRIYVVRSVFSVYGYIFIIATVFVIMILFSIILVFSLWRKIDKWRTETNLKLAKAVSEAHDANQAKSKFLAQMSHEIRTPINAVLGMNEMILRETNDSEIINHAHDIRQSGKMLLLLVNSILDFSKIENGNDDITPIQYNVKEMIKELVSEINPLASEHNLELNTDIDETLPTTLYGDKVKLVQIIINLLTNAVKYTPKGSVTLNMSVESVEDGRLLFHVAVKDTGIGIKEENLSLLCKSFQRLDLEKNHSIEGTGLGLYIVKHFLEKMDSSLVIESVYGQGSEFSFTIKQDIIDSTPIGSNFNEDKSVSDENSTYLFAPSARVLVVDDNEMNRKVAKMLLKRSQMIIELSDSGLDCIEKVKKSQYDIILLDQMMPGMNGTETLAKIRGEHLIPDTVPIIVMTANAISGAKEEYFAAGFDDYVSKPIDSEELEKTLIHWLPKDKTDLKTLAEMEAYNTQKNVNSASPVKAYKEPLLNYLHERVAEMDVDSGLNSCGGNEEFYVQMLYMFAEISLPEDLSRLYDEGDFKNYCITIHGFKNNAYSMGLKQMGDLAFAMEKGTKTEFSENIPEMQADILSQFTKICDAIKNFKE